eukprot:329563-Pleurochrysis_carterae.AAC.3
MFARTSSPVRDAASALPRVLKRRSDESTLCAAPSGRESVSAEQAEPRWFLRHPEWAGSADESRLSAKHGECESLGEGWEKWANFGANQAAPAIEL